VGRALECLGCDWWSWRGERSCSRSLHININLEKKFDILDGAISDAVGHDNGLHHVTIAIMDLLVILGTSARCQ